MLELVYLSSGLGGALLASLGFYISKLRLTTITFAVAHAALAGAAIAIVINFDPTLMAMLFSCVTGALLGYLIPRMSDEDRNNVAMMMFSLFNAVAILAIYLGNTVVLATARIGGILWGSVLAITIEKFFYLLVLTMIFVTYLVLFKRHLDTIVFDPHLAEAEGIDVAKHSMITILLTSIAIALLLRIVGGFLIFTLVYVPVLVANTIAQNAGKQLVTAIVMGSASCFLGTTISYVLDLPIGTSIALTTSILALILFVYTNIRNKIIKKKLYLEQVYEQNRVLQS